MWTDIWPAPIRTPGEKLIELKLKTDRNLKSLLEKSLEQASQLRERGDKQQAEIAYAQAVTLLRLLRTLPARDRHQLQQQIAELRAELDQSAPRRRVAFAGR